MKTFVIAALALAPALALAQAKPEDRALGTTTSQQRQATPTAANSQLSKGAEDHWKQHSRDGYMTREQAMTYKGEDGKPYMREGRAMEFSQIDGDGDGRISQREWMMYHGGESGAGAATNAPGASTSR